MNLFPKCFSLKSNILFSLILSIFLLSSSFTFKFFSLFSSFKSSFISSNISSINVPTFTFSSKSPNLWIPITLNKLNKIIGDPDEPCSVWILCSNSYPFIFIISPLPLITLFLMDILMIILPFPYIENTLLYNLNHNSNILYL